MKTFDIQLVGRVQGVGFRPTLALLASRYGWLGTVQNCGSHVNLRLMATGYEEAEKAVSSILSHLPPHAFVEKYQIKETEVSFFENFQIIDSQANTAQNNRLTPDLATCEACQTELLDPSNRRYGYAYNACAQCGPRYSVATALPFDRATTTMADFELCEECLREYTDPTNRRFHAQLISCPACGVKHTLYENLEGKFVEINATQTQAIELIINALSNEKIVAVKGIGGFLLLCDATNEAAVKTLRIRKNRPSKPFAVLVGSWQEVEAKFELSPSEQEALSSTEGPIVLLRPKGSATVCPEVNPGLHTVGVMLPYSPLLKLIAEGINKPLVATSANISGSPIYADGHEARQDFIELADIILDNNRPIEQPQDDSVVRFTPTTQQRVFLRRSRGYAPDFESITNLDLSVLAMGATQKNTFSWVFSNHTFVSPYLGDLSNYLTQEHLKETLTRTQKLFSRTPEVIVVDKHPGYFSTQLGSEMADYYQAKIEIIQHHEAHVWAVLAENNLIKCPDNITCFCWDGTGLGHDGAIWGGETFSYLNGELRRENHLAYFTSFAQDKFAEQPRLPAFSLADNQFVEEYFSENELRVYSQLKLKSNLLTSSVGRLFDAAACIILDMSHQAYEGEAAMKLEAAATNFYLENIDNLPACKLPVNEWAGVELISELIIRKNRGENTSELAFLFHDWLVCHIEKLASKLNTPHLAFSGGVFQNALLVELIQVYLGNCFKLYFHKNLSPNDENISFGQAVAVVREQ